MKKSLEEHSRINLYYAILNIDRDNGFYDNDHFFLSKIVMKC